MYGTYVPQAAQGETPDVADLERIDLALRGLRRAWAAPAGVAHEGGVVEGSTLLVCLVVAEADPGAEVSITDVTRSLGVVHSTASRLVARAVEAQMVHRTGAATDPRRASLALTPAGKRLVAASRAFRTARLRDLLGTWPRGDVTELARLLTALSNVMANVMANVMTNAPPPGQARLDARA